MTDYEVLYLGIDEPDLLSIPPAIEGFPVMYRARWFTAFKHRYEQTGDRQRANGDAYAVIPIWLQSRKKRSAPLRLYAYVISFMWALSNSIYQRWN